MAKDRGYRRMPVTGDPLPTVARAAGRFKCAVCGRTKDDAHRQPDLPAVHPTCRGCFPLTLQTSGRRDVRGATAVEFTITGGGPC